ncbi:MAG: hypothetical protein R2708_10685 [Vicinamibacterales bacterium]
MVSRRSFLGIAAAAPFGPAALSSGPRPAQAGQPAPGGRVPAGSDGITVRRAGRVEVAFKSPTPRPNGLQATPEGLWIIDQGPGSRASLVRYADGSVIRSFETDTVRPSGITFDGQALWIGSTFSYENVRVDATTGAVIERRPTPGCTTYAMAGDPPQRRSPLAPPPVPRPAAAAAAPAPARLTQAPHLRFQGAHGQEWRNGRLWTTATCARAIFEVDPVTWTVHRVLATPGPRPHGLAFQGRDLWHNDGDLHAFFRYDLEANRIVERVNLGDGDPLSHGLTIQGDTFWYCDDVGVICRLPVRS